MTDAILLEADTHTRLFEPDTIIMVDDANDKALFAIAYHALITSTILPSGLKMPSAPDGYVWKITSRNQATLVQL